MADNDWESKYRIITPGKEDRPGSLSGATPKSSPKGVPSVVPTVPPGSPNWEEKYAPLKAEEIAQPPRPRSEDDTTVPLLKQSGTPEWAKKWIQRPIESILGDPKNSPGGADIARTMAQGVPILGNKIPESETSAYMHQYNPVATSLARNVGGTMATAPLVRGAGALAEKAGGGPLADVGSQAVLGGALSGGDYLSKEGMNSSISDALGETAKGFGLGGLTGVGNRLISPSAHVRSIPDPRYRTHAPDGTPSLNPDAGKRVPRPNAMPESGPAPTAPPKEPNPYSEADDPVAYRMQQHRIDRLYDIEKQNAESVSPGSIHDPEWQAYADKFREYNLANKKREVSESMWNLRDRQIQELKDAKAQNISNDTQRLERLMPMGTTHANDSIGQQAFRSALAAGTAHLTGAGPLGTGAAAAFTGAAPHIPYALARYKNSDWARQPGTQEILRALAQQMQAKQHAEE